MNTFYNRDFTKQDFSILAYRLLLFFFFNWGFYCCFWFFFFFFLAHFASTFITINKNFQKENEKKQTGGDAEGRL